MPDAGVADLPEFTGVTDSIAKAATSGPQLLVIYLIRLGEMIMNNPYISIKRAIALMDTPLNVDDYVILKIMPDGGGCCCTHCRPETWSAVNHHIAPAGHIGHEGNVLLGHSEAKFVLEDHESGPEIIVYLGVVTASLLTVKAVLELITVILKNISQDRKRQSRIRIVKRSATKGEFKEEVILEVDLPLSDKMAKELESQVGKSLKGQ